LAGLALGFFLASGAALAHHGMSAYDTRTSVTLEGTVTKFEFINPHVLIHFDTKDDKGNVEPWEAEVNPPNSLYRTGWDTNTLKPGDNITATGFAAKDGRKLMILRKIKWPNGKVVTLGPQ